MARRCLQNFRRLFIDCTGCKSSHRRVDKSSNRNRDAYGTDSVWQYGLIFSSGYLEEEKEIVFESQTYSARDKLLFDVSVEMTVDQTSRTPFFLFDDLP